MEPHWLVRVVEYFCNETDELAGEFVLPPVELSALQSLWNVARTEPMVECFPIKEEQAQFFRNLFDLDFDFARYDYFLAAYTSDWETTKRDGGYMGSFPPPKELPTFPDARRVMPKTAS
jgi:hypothetical protein